MSVLTYVPAAVFGIGWVILGRTDGIVPAAGLVAAIGAVVDRLHDGHDLRVAEADRRNGTAASPCPAI